jgi:hypothetical protein
VGSLGEQVLKCWNRRFLDGKISLHLSHLFAIYLCLWRWVVVCQWYVGEALQCVRKRILKGRGVVVNKIPADLVALSSPPAPSTPLPSLHPSTTMADTQAPEEVSSEFSDKTLKCKVTDSMLTPRACWLTIGLFSGL